MLRPNASMVISRFLCLLAATTAQCFYTGHDLSSLKLLEDGGAIYKDTTQNDIARPAEDILQDGGMNTVRLQ